MAADAEAEGAAAAAAPDFPSVTLSVRIASANLLNPDEDHAAAVSTFVRVKVVGACASWWWPLDGGADAGADDPDAPTGSALSAVGSGPVPSYAYSQDSKPFLLTDDNLTGGCCGWVL